MIKLFSKIFVRNDFAMNQYRKKITPIFNDVPILFAFSSFEIEK